MSERRKKADWVIVAAGVLAVFVPLAIYVVGYYAMATTVVNPNGKIAIVRLYDANWKYHIYRPAAQVESFLTGNQVLAGIRDRD